MSFLLLGLKGARMNLGANWHLRGLVVMVTLLALQTSNSLVLPCFPRYGGLSRGFSSMLALNFKSLLLPYIFSCSCNSPNAFFLFFVIWCFQFHVKLVGAFLVALMKFQSWAVSLGLGDQCFCPFPRCGPGPFIPLPGFFFSVPFPVAVGFHQGPPETVIFILLLAA